jgi:hypothetical protein
MAQSYAIVAKGSTAITYVTSLNPASGPYPGYWGDVEQGYLDVASQDANGLLAWGIPVNGPDSLSSQTVADINAWEPDGGHPTDATWAIGPLNPGDQSWKTTVGWEQQ